MRTAMIAGSISLALVPHLEISAGPRCELADGFVDFGKVPQFEERVRVVKVKNAGDSNLEIESVRTCCGFAATLRSQKTVPPRGSTDILLTCKPLMKTGKVQDKLLIVSNDRERPIASLPIRAEVIRQFAFTPRALNFGTLEYGETKTLRLRMQANSGGRIRNVKLNYPQKIFDMQTIAAADGATVEIEVSVRPAAPVGGFSSLIEGTCVTDREKPIAFYVHGSVIGKILVMPPKLIFARVAPGRSYEKTVTLIGRNERKFSVIEVKCDSESVALKTASVSEFEHVVTASVAPAEGGSNLRALITVATDDELHKIIQVPVLVLYGR